MTWVRRALPLTFLTLTCVLSPAKAHSQSVSEKAGDIYFTSNDGRTIQLTSSALDSDPSLSVGGSLVVFVRRTPEKLIETGNGEQEANELWIGATSGSNQPRRILAGHAGGFKPDDTVVLAGFQSPQFSPDARRIYFTGTAWATSSPIFVLDLDTQQTRFLFDGLSVEVITRGKFAGCLIANKKIPAVLIARKFRYWLVDRDGKDIAEIGDSYSDVETFKAMTAR